MAIVVPELTSSVDPITPLGDLSPKAENSVSNNLEIDGVDERTKIYERIRDINNHLTQYPAEEIIAAIEEISIGLTKEKESLSSTDTDMIIEGVCEVRGSEPFDPPSPEPMDKSFNDTLWEMPDPYGTLMDSFYNLNLGFDKLDTQLGAYFPKFVAIIIILGSVLLFADKPLKSAQELYQWHQDSGESYSYFWADKTEEVGSFAVLNTSTGKGIVLSSFAEKEEEMVNLPRDIVIRTGKDLLGGDGLVLPIGIGIGAFLLHLERRRKKIEP